MPTGNFNFNPAQSNNNFGFTTPQLPQLQTPSTNFSPQNFGFNSGTGNTGMLQNTNTQDLSGGLDFSLGQTPTQPDMISGAQNMFDQQNGMGGMPQNQGLTSDWGFQDTVNTGMGIAQLGAGIYFQNKQLKQGQQQIDLTRDKYNDYLAREASLDTASNERNAKARQQLGFGG